MQSASGSDPSGRRGVLDLLLGVALLAGGQGAAGTLMSIRVAERSSLVAGLVGSAYFGGMLLGILGVASLVARVGSIRTFTAAAGGLAVSLAGVGAFDMPAAWVLCRGLSGACMAMLYATTEHWLAARTAPASRGQTLAIYTVTLYSALSLGQILVSVVEPTGDARRLAGAMMLAAGGVVPVALTRATAPAWPTAAPPMLRRLVRDAPVGLVAAVAAGAICGSLVSLGPMALRRFGFADAAVAAFMGAVWSGGLVVQLPVGRASDRWGRRPVLAAAGALSAAGLLLLGLGLYDFGPRVASAVLALSTAAAAGLSFTFYPLGAAYTLDRVSADDTTGATRALLLSYAVGSGLGPLVVSALIATWGPLALFFFVAGVAAAVTTFTLIRLRLFALLPPGARSRVLLLPRTSPLATEMDPRTSERHS